jgi:hypothetical protein
VSDGDEKLAPVLAEECQVLGSLTVSPVIETVYLRSERRGCLNRVVQQVDPGRVTPADRARPSLGPELVDSQKRPKYFNRPGTPFAVLRLRRDYEDGEIAERDRC